MRHQPPGGQHRCLRCCFRSGFSSAPWSRSSTLCLWSRCFTTLCRRWWNSCWTFSHLSILVLPSRLSKYPRSCVHPALLAQSSGAPQTAEKLVEVPTIISYSSLLQQTLEQNVDIPVRSRGGRNVDLQGFLPRQSSTAPAVAQIVDNPASGGGLQGFRPGQSSSASFSSPAGVHDYADEPVKGFFGLFPGSKVRSPPRVRVRGCPPVAAHGLGRLMIRVLWLMTTNASLWTMLAVSGPGLLRTLGWTLLVGLGYMFVVRAHSTGGTWTLRPTYEDEGYCEGVCAARLVALCPMQQLSSVSPLPLLPSSFRLCFCCACCLLWVSPSLSLPSSLLSFKCTIACTMLTATWFSSSSCS